MHPDSGNMIRTPRGPSHAKDVQPYITPTYHQPEFTRWVHDMKVLVLGGKWTCVSSGIKALKQTNRRFKSKKEAKRSLSNNEAYSRPNLLLHRILVS